VTVRKKLDKVRPEKAAGIDELSPSVWKEIERKICFSILRIMKTF